MENYNTLIRETVQNGKESDDRTGVGTIKNIGQHLRFDLSVGFPAVTTKKLAINTVISELIFFMQPIPDRRLMQEYQFGNFKEERFDIWKGNCLDMAKKQPVKFNGYNLGNMYPVYWRRKPEISEQYTLVKVPDDIDQDKDCEDLHYNGESDPLYETFKSIWESMFISSEFTVSERWNNYNNFLSDIRCVPFFFEFLQNPTNYSLDCTYYGTNVYSRSTTIFLRNDIRDKMYFDDGKEYVKYSTGEIVSNTFYKNNKPLFETKVEYHKTPTGYICRPKLFSDQLQNLIDEIKLVRDNPHHSAGRRLIMDSWNPNWAHDSVLGICHPWVQCFVDNGKLSLMFTMRSSDQFLGLPFNIASYAVLTHILADICDLDVGELIYSAGDSHVYKSHLEAVKEQLSREPKALPTFKLKHKLTNIEDFNMDSWELINYDHHPAIKAPMAV